jgi:hypothetical protein
MILKEEHNSAAARAAQEVRAIKKLVGEPSCLEMLDRRHARG